VTDHSKDSTEDRLHRETKVQQRETESDSLKSRTEQIRELIETIMAKMKCKRAWAGHPHKHVCRLEAGHPGLHKCGKCKDSYSA